MTLQNNMEETLGDFFKRLTFFEFVGNHLFFWVTKCNMISLPPWKWVVLDKQAQTDSWGTLSSVLSPWLFCLDGCTMEMDLVTYRETFKGPGI